MAEMLEYPPLPTFQVIERLRELRTAQVHIRNMMKTKSLPVVERARINLTMGAHIDALGNAIEQLEGLAIVTSVLNELRQEVWSERSLTDDLKAKAEHAVVHNWAYFAK